MLDRDKKLILIGCGKRGLGHLKAMDKFNKSPRSKYKPSDHTPIELEIS